MEILEKIEVEQFGKNYGTIEHCNLRVTIYGNGYYWGGVTGINCGIIQYCMNYNDITCNQFAGGISGYNQGGCVLYSGNVANISTVNEFAGGMGCVTVRGWIRLRE